MGSSGGGIGGRECGNFLKQFNDFFVDRGKGWGGWLVVGV